MKTMKKLASVALALVMALSLAVPALAAGGEGSITISNAAKDQTYTIYRIFDLDSYNEAVNAYAYKVNDNWKTFVDGDDVKGKYVTVDETTGLVSWVKDADVNDFAALALAYAKENITPAESEKQTAAEDGNLTFEGLELGYYLVDSSMGALCALNTTTPSVTVTEKNEKPTIEKTTVAPTGNQPGVGDSIQYQITVNAKKGAEGYVVHDTMSKGLTFNNDVKVYIGEDEVDASNYTVSEETTDGCTFELTFDQDYLETITADTALLVKYSATINADAVTLETVDELTNKASLSYGDASRTEETTETKTDDDLYDFQLAKTSSDDRNAEILTGAEFQLYTAAEGGEPIALVKLAEGVYRPATKDEIKDETETTTTIAAGIATVKGLGAGTYYLEETKAPDGYNKLSTRESVAVVEDKSLGDVETEEKEITTGEGADAVTTTINSYVKGGVRVINLTGTELPHTGGMGTTILYIAGGVLVAGAVILLITKKRMSADEE